MNPYEILEVDVKADKPKIKRAYRKKAQKHHPDAGGDIQTFQMISLAYETLMDDEKRANFDETGSIEKTDFDKLLEALITQAFENSDTPVVDMLKALMNQIKTFKNHINQIEKSIKTQQKKLDKFLSTNSKKQSTTRVKVLIEKIISTHTASIIEKKYQLSVIEKAQEYFSDLITEETSPPPGTSSSIFAATPEMITQMQSHFAHFYSQRPPGS